MAVHAPPASAPGPWRPGWRSPPTLLLHPRGERRGRGAPRGPFPSCRGAAWIPRQAGFCLFRLQGQNPSRVKNKRLCSVLLDCGGRLWASPDVGLNGVVEVRFGLPPPLTLLLLESILGWSWWPLAPRWHIVTSHWLLRSHMTTQDPSAGPWGPGSLPPAWSPLPAPTV